MITVLSVKKVGENLYDFELKGPSSEDKPTDTIDGCKIAPNSAFLETDTLNVYFFDGEAWE